MKPEDHDTLNFSDLTDQPVGQEATPKQSQAHLQANETIVGVPRDTIVQTPAPQDVQPALTSTENVETAVEQPSIVNETHVPQAPEEVGELKQETDEDYSFFGHVWQKTKAVSKTRPAKYVFIAAVSIGIFMLVFNLPIIIAGVKYRFAKTQPEATPVTTENVQTAEAVAPQPVVIIPKINVNAPIQFPPTLEESQIQLSLRDGVAHYAGTALPGQNGNIVIFGHSSNDWWQPGNYKFVFALLDRMAVGDTIQVNYESKKYVYQVVSSKVVVPTDFSVVQPTAEPTLTLITCTPPGTSWKRLVIAAKQIEPSLNESPTLAVQTPESVKSLPSDAPGVWSKITSFFRGIFS